MKKREAVNKINTIAAKGALSSARAGAGITSRWGFYQPRVPKRIAK